MRPLRLLLICAVLASQTLSFAGTPTRPARTTTPGLIEQAVASGELTRFDADVLLARSFTQPIPKRYRGTVATDGTLVLRDVRARLSAMVDGIERQTLQAAVAGIAPGRQLCGTSATPTTHRRITDNFRIDYIDGTIGGGLTIDDYADALDQAWATEVDAFGWAAPPLQIDQYLVKIDPLLEPIYYGYVSAEEKVGDNPNTPWTETESHSSCMVLQANYDNFLFPSSPIASVRSTAAHEFNHSIQFGYGVITGDWRPDDVFVEGGASWVEDEVFDDANDNYFYLWPDFRQPLGANGDFPYSQWILFRGLTERFGPGTPGGAEDVFQYFWEQISKGESIDVQAWRRAMDDAGTPMDQAFHDYAIATKFVRPCGGGYVQPHCYEEAEGYTALAGTTTAHSFLGGPGDSVTATVDDHYALYWIALPSDLVATATLEDLTAEGKLRGSIACDTGATITVTALPPIAPNSGPQSVAFDTTGCADAVFAITNETNTSNKPTTQFARGFTASIS